MAELFDIAEMEVADTFEVVIEHPKTGEPMLVGGTEVTDDDGETTIVGGVPMSVTVYGPGSKAFRAARSAQSNRNMKRARQRGGKVETTDDEDAADTAAFLSSCTISLNNFGYRGLDPSNKETFRALYLDRKMGWLTDQVNKKMGDWGNFTKAAQSS